MTILNTIGMGTCSMPIVGVLWYYSTIVDILQYIQCTLYNIYDYLDTCSISLGGGGREFLIHLFLLHICYSSSYNYPIVSILTAQTLQTLFTSYLSYNRIRYAYLFVVYIYIYTSDPN